MVSRASVEHSLASVVVFCLIFACIQIDFSRLATISAQPTASMNLFSSMGNSNNAQQHNQIDNKPSALAGKIVDPAELSFQQMVAAKSQESTIIGEIKPNSSALELMLLRDKIANTILSMQEMDNKKQQQQQQEHSITSTTSTSAAPSAMVAECYIEVTRVEKVPGKCHRASSGLPICQSDNYVTISKECS